ncbi:MAG: chemotaxis protein CheW [Pirellulales bacterium]|nr:chemotaxis protein CheW [Pirellulales bacterium]
MKTDQITTCYKQIGVLGDGTCEALENYVHCRNCPVFEAAGRQLLEKEPPQEYIDEQTLQLTIEESPDTAGTVALAVFRIGEEWLALDVTVMVEVTEPREIHRVPHRSNRRFLGMVNIRGELQLCLSLGDLLGINTKEEPKNMAEYTTSARFLVTEHTGERWVFSVDEVAGIQRIGLDQLTDVPSTVANSPSSFSKAVFTWQHNSVGVLDCDRLFESLQGSIQ